MAFPIRVLADKKLLKRNAIDKTKAVLRKQQDGLFILYSLLAIFPELFFLNRGPINFQLSIHFHT